MSNIQKLLQWQLDQQLDYSHIIKNFPWIVTENQTCILSPDSDWLLCWLFMNKYYWRRIWGFYDWKILVIDKNLKPSDCIFLDIEVNRSHIRSMWHHMLVYNYNKFDESLLKHNCIQPNTLRKYDVNTYFRLKYPLATIHMLMWIVDHHKWLSIPTSAICPLFFTDGVFNVLFSYPENVLNRLHFLWANNTWTVLNSLFKNEEYSVHDLIIAMDDFFKKRDAINAPKERWDRIKISNKDSTPYNIEWVQWAHYINTDAKSRAESFLTMVWTQTWRNYNKADRKWDWMKMYKFIKWNTQTDWWGKKISVWRYNDWIAEKNPLSWAITSADNIEYTIENWDIMD